MTVEVIGQDSSYAKTITHRACGAVLRYIPNDIRTLWTGKDISGSASGVEGFTCPQCGRDVVVRSW